MVFESATRPRISNVSRLVPRRFPISPFHWRYWNGRHFTSGDSWRRLLGYPVKTLRILLWLIFIAVLALGYPLMSRFPAAAGREWWLALFVRLMWFFTALGLLYWIRHKP